MNNNDEDEEESVHHPNPSANESIVSSLEDEFGTFTEVANVVVAESVLQRLVISFGL